MPKSSDLIFNPKLTPIVVLAPYGPGFAELVKHLQEDRMLQVVECASVPDALTVIRQANSCLLVTHIRTVQDLAHLLVALRSVDVVLRAKGSRVLVTSVLNGAEALSKLAHAGVSEVLPVPGSVKGLQYKAERLIKQLPQSVAQAAAQAGSDAASTTGLRAGVRLMPALDLGDDDMFVLSGGGARRDEGRWTVRLKGPSPSWGRWAPDPAGQDLWRWRSNALAGVGDCEWLWIGAKPDFQAGFWVFAGAEPSLGFFRNGLAAGFKLNLSEKGSLCVAADTPAALKLTALAAEGAAQPRVAAGIKIESSVLAPVLGAETEKQVVPAEMKIESVTDDERLVPRNSVPLAAAVTGARLSLLGLGFLVSELVGSVGSSLDKIVAKYCEYASQALGGSRVELWMALGTDWQCLGTSDGNPAVAVEIGGREPVSFVVKGSDGVTLGRIVVSELDGEERDYGRLGEAAARIAVGILLGARAGALGVSDAAVEGAPSSKKPEPLVS
jgi:hypothetical protein